MLCKLVIVASLAVGVFCPVTSSNTAYSVNIRSSNFVSSFDITSNDAFWCNHLWTMREVAVIATQYCDASNAEDKLPEVMASIKTFPTCLMEEIPPDAITRDIEEAKHKKYCVKSPQLKECTRGLIKGVAPCLPPRVVSTLEKIIFTLIDFLCHNDGARITSFNEYVPCFNEKETQLVSCVDVVRLNVSKLGILYGGCAAGELIALDKEQCGIVDNGLSCVTNALKNCSSKTPAELSQELHDIILDSMACTRETYETQTEVVVDKVNVAAQALLPSSGIGKDLDFLMKRKLELEVRTAELDIWNRENELKVQHTILTSDVKTRL